MTNAVTTETQQSGTRGTPIQFFFNDMSKTIIIFYTIIPIIIVVTRLLSTINRIFRTEIAEMETVL